MKTLVKIILLAIFILALIGIVGKNIEEKGDKPKSDSTCVDTSAVTTDTAYLVKFRNDSIADAKWYKTKAGKIQKKHPEWTKDECEAIADGKIWIGMTYEMLVYRRGKPNSVNTSNYGKGNEYQACWDDFNPSCYYFGEDHVIKSYN